MEGNRSRHDPVLVTNTNYFTHVALADSFQPTLNQKMASCRVRTSASVQNTNEWVHTRIVKRNRNRCRVIFTPENQNFGCLQECQDILIQFIWPRQGLAVFIFGSSICFSLNSRSGLLLVLSILISFGAYVYVVLTSNSSLILLDIFAFG